MWTSLGQTIIASAAFFIYPGSFYRQTVNNVKLKIKILQLIQKGNGRFKITRNVFLNLLYRLMRNVDTHCVTCTHFVQRESSSRVVSFLTSLRSVWYFHKVGNVLETRFSLKSHCAVVVVLLFYVHGKHLRSCRDGQLT